MSTVLVVDDEDSARFTLGEMLKAAGHDVVEARNGVEGLDAAGAQEFDIVITDIIMPDKEGIEFIRDLKEADGNRPVIAISGGGRTRNLDFLEIARQFGADAVLAKPFTAADLTAVMAQVAPASDKG